MKKRIGNDIQFTWRIYRKDGETQVPESFDGKDVEVKLISPLRQPVTIEDVSIATGVVTFTFRGKHQVTLGNYVAVLLENKGEDGMVTLDVVNAVTLVPHSYMEEDGDEGDVIEAESVELTSTISAGDGGGFVQQQADWAQTDDTAVNFILNKPDLEEYAMLHNPNRFTETQVIEDERYRATFTQQYIELRDKAIPSNPALRIAINGIYKVPNAGTINGVVWEETATEQIPAATTSAPGLMSAEDKQKITDIEAVIPEQASSSNQLADKNFVNSSIATATATYRGAYNLVTDLHLSVSATHAQIATALATAIQTADNNDYCYVQIPTADDTPTEFASVERYKFNGTAWGYEYTLNNSGFTAAQWAALNSGITSGLVAKLSALPTNSELITLLAGKANTADLAEVATSGSYNDLSDKPTIPAAQVQSDWNEGDTTSKAYIKNKPTIPTVPTNVSAFNNDAGYIREDDVDDVPTANSDNPVKSSGLYSMKEELDKTTDAIGRVEFTFENGSLKSQIPTNTGSLISGGSFKGYDYDVQNLTHKIFIYSNIKASDIFPTVVLWALYDGPASASNMLACGTLLSTGIQKGECDLSLYPTGKILRVVVDTSVTTPIVHVTYYHTDFITHEEMEDVLRTTDVIDSLDSEQTDKPLSAKQGKKLNEKINDVSAYDQEDVIIQPKSTGGSNIPKSNGTTMSGGGIWRRNDYNVSGINKIISISTDAKISTISGYADAVYYILKDSNSNVLYAGPSILSPNPSPATIDLSAYPNASTLQITVDGTTRSSSVSYTDKVAKFVPVEDIIDTLDSTSTDKPLSANQGRVLDEKITTYYSDIAIALPSEIVVVGKNSSILGNRLQIYYRDIISVVDPFRYYIKPICSGGQIKHRYFGYDAKNISTGNIPFTLKLLSDNGKVVSEKSTTIKIIAPPTSPISNKNILLLGSSTLGTGTTARELHRRLCMTSGSNDTNRANPKGLGLTNISFVGRKGGSIYNEVLQEAVGGAGYSKKYAIDSDNQIRFYISEGNVEVGDVYTDGVTNYTVTEDNVATVGGGNFLTAQATDPVSASGTLTKVSGDGDATIAYTSYYKESGNPFWDRTLATPGLNFQMYADNYCNGSIDIIVSLMTTNDLAELHGDVDTLLTNYVKPFVRKYHSDFPNGKFIFGIQPPYSIYGGTNLTYEMKYWTIQYAIALYEMAEDDEFSSYFSIAHTLQIFDNDYMFPLSEEPVANRLPDIKEKETVNGTHPTGSGGQFQAGDSEAGCLTIADSLYYAICDKLEREVEDA